MVMMSSGPSVHSTARRFAACARTTNLLNESAISLLYRSYEPVRRLVQKSLYEAVPLKTGSSYHPPMLWLKALHVIAVVTWFAGLFYLPRLFVYHADAKDAISTQRFEIMERRLFTLMTIGAAASIFFGLTMLIEFPLYLQM